MSENFITLISKATLAIFTQLPLSEIDDAGKLLKSFIVIVGASLSEDGA